MRTAPVNRRLCRRSIWENREPFRYRSTPLRTNPFPDLLERERKAHDRCKVVAKLIAWQIDLTARIKVQQTEIVHGDFSCDPRALQAEVERLKLAIRLFKECRR